MSEKVLVARRKEAEKSAFGLDAGGVKWEAVGEFWASVAFQRGMRQMREGALDAYDVVMVRMRWNERVSRESILKYDGRWYQIESFNRSYRDNIIQITAREMVGEVAIDQTTQLTQE